MARKHKPRRLQITCLFFEDDSCSIQKKLSSKFGTLCMLLRTRTISIQIICIFINRIILLKDTIQWSNQSCQDLEDEIFVTHKNFKFVKHTVLHIVFFIAETINPFIIENTNDIQKFSIGKIIKRQNYKKENNLLLLGLFSMLKNLLIFSPLVIVTNPSPTVSLRWTHCWPFNAWAFTESSVQRPSNFQALRVIKHEFKPPRSRPFILTLPFIPTFSNSRMSDFPSPVPTAHSK